MSSSKELTSSRRVTPLNDVNYAQWAKEMRAYLAENKLWFIVIGTIKEPSAGDPEHITYLEKSAQAAGAMFLAVDASQHKVSGARYNALDAVFAVRKQPDESLPSLASRVDTLVQTFKDLCPDSYTLEQLLADLAAMSMLRSLPQEYDSFTSGLIQRDATKSEIVQAFVREHQTRNGRQDGSASAETLAMRVATPTASKADLLCDFCEMKGHDEEHCFAKRDARSAARQKAAERRQNRRNNKKGGSQHAQEAAAVPNSTQAISMAYAVEHALDTQAPLVI
ncbi:hypothetical protein PUNSTDRAFT_130615 [Punctularia strigosozonata HHB-11173 SS5]|uniref:uncharacterized protein n=1 Tax=Punctularia strigosozonata (strain HHB-11173) TaxID=741275 RepID=UPI0004417A87|nr:uncharacterized protein PUNSTDRAFT_130615 [Punctularia strigosozonata HHB-11173 SS5]EIN12362.1 hypothetical protein PUNSTDRAFT_130615 [Punctularia strigosozonata HHB-11173 SS5]